MAGHMILTLKQAADRLSVCLRTVKNLTASGQLPKVHVSARRVGIPVEAIDNYIARGGWQSDSTAAGNDGSWSSSKRASAYSGVYQKGPPARRPKRSKIGRASCRERV